MYNLFVQSVKSLSFLTNEPRFHPFQAFTVGCEVLQICFKLYEILVSEVSSYILLITFGEFNSCKMYYLEDINENVSS